MSVRLSDYDFTPRRRPVKSWCRTCRLEKNSSSKQKHNAESIKNKTIIFEDRFEKVNFSEENPEQVKKFKELLKRHSKTMEANLRDNRIYDEEKKTAILYIETAKKMIRKINTGRILC